MNAEQKDQFREWLKTHGIRDPQAEFIIKHVAHYFCPDPLPAEGLRDPRIKMLEEMKDWAMDAKDVGDTGDELLYSINDFCTDCDTWIEKCESKALSAPLQPVPGKSKEDAKNKVAQSKGYPNWKEMYDWVARDGQLPSVVAQLIEAATEEAMSEYASSLRGSEWVSVEDPIQHEGFCWGLHKDKSIGFYKLIDGVFCDPDAPEVGSVCYKPVAYQVIQQPLPPLP